METRNYPRVGEQVVHVRLENGLHIYHNPRPEFGKCFAFFAANYGGMDTKFELDGTWRDTPAGVAHFLEHKLFDTEDGNALQDMAALGASPNAFTSNGITGYFFECTEGLEENLRILISFVSIPYFTKESVDKEQGIIAQEIDMRRDTPSVAVFLNLMDALYHNHPIRERVIGSVDSIAQITAETLYDCHRAFYRPSNMVLCTAGNVGAEQIAAIAREILPAQEAEVPVARDYGASEPPEAARALNEASMEVAAPLFYLGFKSAAVPEGEARLRAQLLGDLTCQALLGESSPLYARLYEAGLVNRGFSAGYECGTGYAFAYAGGESRDPHAVRDAVSRELARIAHDGLDAELWIRLKKAAYGSHVRALNSFEHTCIELAQGHFAGADYLAFPDLFDALEKGDAETLLRTWAADEKTALSIIRSKEA